MTTTEPAPTGTDEGADPLKAWHKSVCILCSANCGVEIRLDDREITRVRGNKSHVASKGYTCEKALRINHYQNSTGRLTSPMRRNADGGYDEVDWDTAIAEIAAEFTKIIDQHGGEKIFYYGGGGQGNHLLGAYGAATRRGLGIRHRSNALAQEKPARPGLTVGCSAPIPMATFTMPRCRCSWARTCGIPMASTRPAECSKRSTTIQSDRWWSSTRGAPKPPTSPTSIFR